MIEKKNLFDFKGTSIAYFKRFYLKNSCMEYHPKDIL